VPVKNNPMNVTTPTDREVVVTREFDAPLSLVFEAWTKCEHLQHWLLGPDGWTMPSCQVDLRPGGKYRWGWRHSQNGHEFAMHGVYREIDPPNKIVCTESMEGQPGETLNTLVFTEAGGRTLMTMTILYASKEMREMVLKTGMTSGMETSFNRLESYLESRG
jgi:uncharacterized protein YndB with AHSA1/START domain